MFQKTFRAERDPVTPDNWGKAMGAYARTLVAPSPFDEYLTGKTEALSKTEQRGLRVFIDFCAACHNTAAVGGSILRKFRIVEDYWKRLAV